ncbi:hypothetical protein BASA81_006850 [Batrachochytrium salamandrivorans]|nr:hypothetical protein BASA81_006850 [Batrachochytrium salamandrivorans]
MTERLRTARERSLPTAREMEEMESCRVYTNQELAVYCPGLSLLLDFITEDEETAICEELDQESWDDRLSRRVQHYGYEFDYATRLAISNGLTNSRAFPSRCSALIRQLPDRVAGLGFNQLTVNEYLPGRGIAPHVDSHSCFGDLMLSVSLLADTCIRFVPRSSRLEGREGIQRVNLWVPRRAVLLMEGPSRFAFSHGIASRKSDLVDGVVVPRGARRVSLTFRIIRVPEGCACDYPDTCEAQELKMKPPRLAPRVSPIVQQ